jgi:hypothetical protein
MIPPCHGLLQIGCALSNFLNTTCNYTTRIIYCSHPKLIYVNWFHEKSSIYDLVVSESNFKTSLSFHCKARNFTNLIKRIAKFGEKQWSLIILHNHTTRMVGRRGWACKLCQWPRALAVVDWPGNSYSFGIWPYYGNVDGSNSGLAGDVCIVLGGVISVAPEAIVTSPRFYHLELNNGTSPSQNVIIKSGSGISSRPCLAVGKPRFFLFN